MLCVCGGAVHDKKIFTFGDDLLIVTSDSFMTGISQLGHLFVPGNFYMF